jgi:4-amino-4-deoxy-L-arabinose transferase-like glycosyltransferase
MITLAVSLAALAAIGWRLRRGGGSPDASRATGAVRGALWAFSALIVIEAALGFAGLLTARNVALALCGLGLASWSGSAWSSSSSRRAAEAREPLSRLDGMLASAIAGAFVLLLWTGLHRFNFPYDSLSYHLHATASWMHAQRLWMVPAVFGDTAPAYAPSNVELWFLFLMSPLRSDYLAGCGQLPLAALAVAAVVAAVREAGGRRTEALAAGLAFLLIPDVWEQASTAMVDLGLAAFLLASLPFARRVELPTCAAALGLALGSKFVATVLVVPFGAFALFTLFAARRRSAPVAPWQLLAAAVTLLGTGGFWYVRNALVTGNPIYPGAFPGLHLPALYDAAAMRRWYFHVPVGHLRELASKLANSGVGFATAMVVALGRRPRRAEAMLAVALIALYWLAIPYQEDRFLFAAFGAAAIAIARAAPEPLALLGWGPLAGAILGGVIQQRWVAWLALPLAAALGWLGLPALRRAPRRLRTALGGVAALGLILGVAVGFRGYDRRDPPYGVPAWSWFRAHVRDARVAYAGSNVAFPLAGERVGNRVRYVNVAGEPGDGLHDFAARLGAGLGESPEPTLYREGASFDVWCRNLRAAGSEILFVQQEYPLMRRSIAADAEGFPVERRWADEHPERFSLLYASPAARVYAIAKTP